MARLIDTDNLAEYKFASDRIIPTEWQQGWNDALDTVMNEVPTVDANPVQPIEFEWCHDCKEYDQNAHCCHRWTKVIRNTVNDLKTQGYEIVRHGYWKEDEARIKDQCSVCGLSVNWSQYKTPYCPFCGAKMDEVGE